jgi:hypothetical protein
MHRVFTCCVGPRQASGACQCPGQCWGCPMPPPCPGRVAFHLLVRVSTITKQGVCVTIRVGVRRPPLSPSSVPGTCGFALRRRSQRRHACCSDAFAVSSGCSSFATAAVCSESAVRSTQCHTLTAHCSDSASLHADVGGQYGIGRPGGFQAGPGYALARVWRPRRMPCAARDPGT